MNKFILFLNNFNQKINIYFISISFYDINKIKKNNKINWFSVSSDLRLYPKIVEKYCDKFYFNQFFKNINEYDNFKMINKEDFYRILYEKIGDDIFWSHKDKEYDINYNIKDVGFFIKNNKLSSEFIEDFGENLFCVRGIFQYQKMPENIFLENIDDTSLGEHCFIDALIYQDLSVETKIKYFGWLTTFIKN